MDVTVRPQRRLSGKELMLSNCVLEKTLASPLDSKEIKPVNPKGNQPWIITGRTSSEAEAPILWSRNVKTSSLEKTLKLGKIDGRRRRGLQEEKGTTEDEMVGWHYWLNRHVFEQTQEDSEGQGTWRAEVHGITKQQPPLWSNFNHLISDPMFKYSHFGG